MSNTQDNSFVEGCLGWLTLILIALVISWFARGWILDTLKVPGEVLSAYQHTEVSYRTPDWYCPRGASCVPPDPYKVERTVTTAYIRSNFLGIEYTVETSGLLYKGSRWPR